MNWIKKELGAVYSTHRKWGVALLGVLTTLVTTDTVHGAALKYTNLGIALLVAFGVRAVTNADQNPMD